MKIGRTVFPGKIGKNCRFGSKIFQASKSKKKNLPHEKVVPKKVVELKILHRNDIKIIFFRSPESRAILGLRSNFGGFRFGWFLLTLELHRVSFKKNKALFLGREAPREYDIV